MWEWIKGGDQWLNQENGMVCLVDPSKDAIERCERILGVELCDVYQYVNVSKLRRSETWRARRKRKREDEEKKRRELEEKVQFFVNRYPRIPRDWIEDILRNTENNEKAENAMYELSLNIGTSN